MSIYKLISEVKDLFDQVDEIKTNKFKREIENFKQINSLNYCTSRDLDSEFLNQWLPNIKSKEKIYHPTTITDSNDMFNAKDFHKKCDDKKSTLTIITTTNNRKFGGYTPCAWSSYGDYIPDKTQKSFIFSLDFSTVCFPLKKEYKSIKNFKNDGPVFGGDYLILDKHNRPLSGGGHDIYIRSDSNTELGSFTNLGFSYECDKIKLKYGTPEAREFLAGSQQFTVSEIKVYQIGY